MSNPRNPLVDPQEDDMTEDTLAEKPLDTSKLKVRPDGYIELPKRNRALNPSSTELQDGVEYMYIVWYRQKGETQIQTYAKKRPVQQSQQTITDIHTHLTQLEKQGWYERMSNRDVEGFEIYLERQHIRTVDPNWKPPLPEGVIPLNQRHNADPNKLYCILTIDRDTRPYEWTTQTYGRDMAAKIAQGKMADAQGNTLEQGSTLIAQLESEGWRQVHSEKVRGGLYETVFFERPIDYVLTIVLESSVSPIPESTPSASMPQSASPTTPTSSIPSPARNQTQVAMIGGERCSIVHPKGAMYVEVVQGEKSQRHLSTMPHAMITTLNVDGWAHIATMPSDKQTTYIMGRGGVVLMEAYLDPANHADLPANVRLLRVTEHNGQVTVTTYDKLSANTNPNTSTSAQEFAQKLLGMGKWSLVREDRADGYIVIYLGMQI